MIKIRDFALIGTISIILFFSVHRVFQSDWFYTSVFKETIWNYEHTNGQIYKVQKPYNKIINDNLIFWDGVHFNFIRENGYNIEKAGGIYIYAFFPLFPLVWKATMLSPVGIILFNYILFLVAVMLLWYYFSLSKSKLQLLFIVNMPFIAPFIIPYAESLFFLGITLALIGFKNHKYWLYFIGALITAMTRSAITIILLSIISSELILLLKHHQIKLTLKRSFLALLPLFVGTFMVLLYQNNSGAESFFTYVEAIQTWGRKLSLSSSLSDWSHEGFGLNVATIVFIIPIAIYFVFYQAQYGAFKAIPMPHPIKKLNDTDTYLLLISSVYFIGMFLTVILFQAGNIHGTFRYILCTPFFFYFLFHIIDAIKNMPVEFRNFYYITGLLFGIFTMTVSGYSGKWNFSDFGFLLMFASLVLILTNFQNNRLKQIFFALILILCIFWNTFMFNCYTSNGWIFT